jgi:hypothetical protein
MEVLLRTAYFELEVDPARKYVRYVRSATAFESVATYETVLDRLLEALERVERSHYAILVDMRLGPIRSGDDFDASAFRFRREVFRGFARAAVLVATEIGRLQVTRHAREQGGGPTVFRDEGEALRFLGVAE